MITSKAEAAGAGEVFLPRTTMGLQRYHLLEAVPREIVEGQSPTLSRQQMRAKLRATLRSSVANLGFED